MRNVTTGYYSDFVSRFDSWGVRYEVRKDVDALRDEFKVPASVEIYQALVLAGAAHFFFNAGDKYVGYADEVIGFRLPD